MRRESERDRHNGMSGAVKEAPGNMCAPQDDANKHCDLYTLPPQNPQGRKSQP